MRMTTATRPARFGEVFSVGAYRVLFAAHSLMAVTETMKMLALSVLVYASTGSSLVAALAYMSGMLPCLFAGALLLPLADRVPPRTLLIGFHLVRCASIGLLAAGALPVPALIAASMVAGAFLPVAQAASGVLLCETLQGEAYVLGRSLFSTTAAAAQILGHAAGGVLLLAMSPRGVLAVAAVGCLIAAVAVRTGLEARPGRRRTSGRKDTAAPRDGNVGRLATDVHNGGGVLANKRIRGLLLAQWGPISLAVAAEGVIVPYAAGQGRSGAGLTLSAMAGGMMAGTMLMGRLPARSRDILVLPMALLIGGGLLPFALYPGLPAAMTLGFVGSTGLGYEVGLQQRFVQAVPERQRARAFGLANTGLTAGQAVATVAAGALTGVTGPGLAIGLCGAAVIASVLALSRHLRPQHDRTRGHAFWHVWGAPSGT